MPHVYMFPNPDFGKPTASGAPEMSALLADPLVARLPGVGATLGATQRTVAARAAARLNTVKAASATSEAPGGSKIRIMSGVIDQYVVLDDTASAGAAWKIEADHGILASATPRGSASMSRRESDVKRSEVPDIKPPKGLVIHIGPT